MRIAGRLLFKLTPHYSDIHALLADGLHSSHSIVRMGPGTFARRYGVQLGGEARAREIYDGAHRVQSTVSAIVGNYSAAYDGGGTAVTPKPVIPPADDRADWPTLFGSLSFCTCEHCRSVYGPAAYLVDLLSFLREMKSADGQSAKDVLFARRPDIGEIELSCANTNTLLPYIDLVNEILEDKVAPPVPNDPQRQTAASAEELSIEPEHVNAKAYSELRERVYPWGLPFDRWSAESRSYLERLGTNRYELQEAFYPVANPPDLTREFALNDKEIAREYLGMTAKEWDIIAGTAPEQPWQLWGYTNGPNGAAPANWVNDLAQVSVLLKRSGLSYSELSELLATRYINSGGGLSIEPPDTCTLDEMVLGGANAKAVARIVRFVRLRRRLAWTVFDLDRAILALRPPVQAVQLDPVDEAFLVQISHLARLTITLRLPVIKLLTFWAPIDTTSYQVPGRPLDKSLYERLFQNRSVVPKEELEAVSLPLVGNHKVKGRIPVLLSVLSISETDLGLLLTALGLTESSSLSVSVLSALYRHSSLAKALKISVADLLAMLSLTGIDPFFQQAGKALTGKTLIFVEKLRALRASPFSAAQLDYLYRHRDPEGKLAPSPKEVIALAASLATGLNRIAREICPLPPTSDALSKELGKIMDPAKAAEAAAYIDSVPLDDDPNDAAKPQRRLVDGYFNSFLANPDYKTLLAKATLNGAESDAFRIGAITYLLEQLQLFLKNMQQREFIEKTLSDSLKLEKNITANLLERLLKSRADPNQPALHDFLQLSGIGLKAWYKGQDQNGHEIELTRTDPAIDFTWGTSTPAERIDTKKSYTVSWRAALLPPRTENYTFHVRTTGNVSLSLNHQDIQLAPSISSGQINEVSGSAELVSGQLTLLRLEYEAESSSYGMIQLSWSSSSMPKAIIPSTQWYPQSELFGHFSHAYTLLHKAGLLVNGFKLTAKELDYLSSHGSDFAGADPADPDNETKAAPFDLNLLPLDSAAFRPAFFAGWERLRDLCGLRDSLPAGEVGLTDVFSLATETPENARKRLATATGWDSAELTDLSASDLRNEMALVRLRDQLHIARFTNVPTVKLRDWSLPTPDPQEAQNEARAIRAVWKAKYDEESWAVAAKPLSNTLREQRRSALTDYLITATPYKDTNALYDDLLIDVEMSAVQMTSRIKQAISSVQLFVQRCLLGLETDLSIGEDFAREWKWRKNYRVWEANRKVFLYPENWIEPELRDDKTPFFRELENELLQGDITTESAKTAYLNYLFKLDAVSKLEVCGLFHQVSMAGIEKMEVTTQGWPEVNILHVFARSSGTNTKTYYYRRWVDGMYWTSWEKVGIDIQGDHLLPVVYNGRLRLFWPDFKEMSQNLDQPQTTPPLKYWEIKLAWSEYQNGKWTSKKVFETSISTYPFFWDRSRYTFTSDTSEGELKIFCWERIQALESQSETGEFQTAHIPNAPKINMRVGYFIFIDYCHNLIDSSSVLVLPLTKPTIAPRRDEGYNLWYARWKRLLLPPYGGVTKAPFGYEFLHQFQDFVESLCDQLQYRNFTSSLLPNYSCTLGSTPGRFRVLFPKMYGDLEEFQEDFLKKANAQYSYCMPTRQAFAPYFFKDYNRVYFVSPQLVFQPKRNLSDANSSSLTACPPFTLSYRFHNFYHPYICLFIEQLNRNGLDGFLAPPDQVSPLRRQLSFSDYFLKDYAPETVVNLPYPIDVIDFNPGGAYSQYNWEIFFHIPLLIATRLMQNQRFDEAREWFHYVFNPTLSQDSSYDDRQNAANWLTAVRGRPINLSNSDYWNLRRFWKIQPFYLNCLDQLSMEYFLEILGGKEGDESSILQTWLELQIELWRRNPFNPHMLARLRITPYQKNVVMKYVDNLIAWGDQLFRRETLESINEATLLYILAAEILGPRPVEIQPPAVAPIKTYNDLEPDLDAFRNALVKVENLLPTGPSSMYGQSKPEAHGSLPEVLYFCVPNNPELLARWDTVADRLFKIRHSMNIEGVFRELALFEPPINPALLVKAAAVGLDIGSVLADLSAPLPYYRFATQVQRALELCNDLQALGNALLSALEKRDAEALTAIRATQESEVLVTMKLVKDAQIDEAQASIDALGKSKALATARKQHYTCLLAQRVSLLTPFGEIEIPPGLPLNSMEAISLLMDFAAMEGTYLLAGAEAAVALSHAAPDQQAGSSGSGGHAVTVTGGKSAGDAESAGVRAIRDAISTASMAARMADKMAGFTRRQEDWEFQKELSEKEELQIQAQIDSACKHKSALERELDVTKKQQEHADSVKEYLQNKFTNTDLYGWMIGQVSGIYFQSYKLAYDIAKQAERCYRFELGVDDSNFIQFGYWDGLNKGLLAGEKLRHDLRRLELAYAEKNRREYEITKHVSLLLLDPAALMALRETGTCEFALPEALFDLDFPGHYFRRIKSVSITIPSVVGPYTGVNCTLTLLRNSLRKTSLLMDSPYARMLEGDDLRFTDNLVPMQAIATSSGQNDSGLFELNFHDERYLPFEGAGAISRWRVELPREFRQFDYETITDVVLHVKYTAREGGKMLGDQVLTEMKGAVDLLLESGKENGGLHRLFSIRQEFPDAWHRFLSQPDNVEFAELKLDLAPSRFPFLLRGRALKMQAEDFYLRLREGSATESDSTYADLCDEARLLVTKFRAPDGQEQNTVKIGPIGKPLTESGAISAALSETVPWQLQADLRNVKYREAMIDLLLVCRYTVEST